MIDPKKINTDEDLRLKLLDNQLVKPAPIDDYLAHSRPPDVGEFQPLSAPEVPEVPSPTPQPPSAPVVGGEMVEPAKKPFDLRAKLLESAPSPTAPSPAAEGPQGPYKSIMDTDALKEILMRKNKNDFIDSIGRGAETAIAAFGGRNPNYSPFDASQKAYGDSYQSEIDALKTKLLNGGRGAGVMDPASAKGLWNLLKQRNPGYASTITEQDFYNMPAEHQRAAFSAAGQDTRFDEKKKQDAAKLEETRKRFAAGMERVHGQWKSGMAVRLGEAVAPFAEVQSIFEGLDKDYPGITTGVKSPELIRDMATLNTVLSKVGDRLRTQFADVDPTMLQTRLKYLLAAIIKNQSGLAVTDNERQFYESMLNNKTLMADPAALALSVDMFRRALGSKFQAATQAWQTDDMLRPVFDAFSKESGFSPRNPVWANGTDREGRALPPPGAGGFDDIMDRYRGAEEPQAAQADEGPQAAPPLPTDTPVVEPSAIPPPPPGKKFSAPGKPGSAPSAKTNAAPVTIKSRQSGKAKTLAPERAQYYLDKKDEKGQPLFEVVK